MGPREKTRMRRKRVVLDTNVVVSALLFRGELSRLLTLWKEKSFMIAASREIIDEYIRVLAYPRFKLTEGEIETILQEELLPYIDPVTVSEDVRGACEDPDDDKFLACAVAGRADFILSGDAHLIKMKIYEGCRIITAKEFLRKFQ